MQVATAVTVQMPSLLRAEFFNTGFLVSCNLEEQAEMLSSCTVKMAEDRRLVETRGGFQKCQTG